MVFLLIASLIWAPSFGIIKYNLVGVDASLIAFTRLAVSFIAFAPWCRWRSLDTGQGLRLGLIGAVQYGLMYMTYTASFRYLPAYVVAICTIFTPLYVTLFNDLWWRRVHAAFWLAAALAVVGTGAIVWQGSWAETRMSIPGILLVQVSNACFAAGQLAYRRTMGGRGWRDELECFAPLYLGGALACLPFAVASTHVFKSSLSVENGVSLLYLGLAPSAVGFFLWNLGAARVNAGILAVMNNAKIPLAVIVSFALFGEKAQSPSRLAVGIAIIAAAVGLNQFFRKQTDKSSADRIV